MPEVNETLKERGSVYGPFDIESEMVTGIIKTLGGDKVLNPIAYHSMQMIVVKLVRVFNGDQTYTDNWHDIAGYAKLAEDYFILQKKKDLHRQGAS